MSDVQVLTGDCLALLPTLEAESVQCVVTSPPYFGLRSYNGGVAEIGQESTPEAYVERMVAVFREVRRVLRNDGTAFLNLGDGFSANWNSLRREGGGGFRENARERVTRTAGYAPKQLLGIPWRVAFALQADGWWLRSDIVWAKKAPMPESVTDRPTRSHEFVFLLTKSPRYYYDADAIRERSVEPERVRCDRVGGVKHDATKHSEGSWFEGSSGRNRRDVWTLGPEPYASAHFAVMPTKLVEPCILAGSREGDVVLDPFLGSGTTLQVAKRLGRKGIGIELNPDYCDLAHKRIDSVTTPLPLWSAGYHDDEAV